MKIETDKAHILSGVHHGITIGSPIAILLENQRLEELGRVAARGGAAIPPSTRR